MTKTSLCFSLICLLLITANFSLVSAQTNTDKAASRIAKIKAKIIKLESKNDTGVRIKLTNGKTLKGSVAQTNADSFTVTDKKTRQQTSVLYADVEQVLRSFPKSTTIAILSGFAVAGTILAVIVYGQYHH